MMALVSLVLVGIALTLLLSLGAFAGKSALDPTYRPPLLSDASGSVVLRQQGLGWSLFERSLTGSSGYMMRADLDLRGLKNTKLILEWSVVAAGRRGLRRNLDIARVSRSIIPRSNSESRMVEQWIPRPRHAGLYRVRLALRPYRRSVLDEDQSDIIFVVGADCCSHYKTPMYTSLLPRGWHLDEDFAPNPGKRYVTLARGPVENSLDIDTSLIDPENVGGDPLKKARELEDLVARNGRGYKRLRWRHYQSKGSPTVEWSYRLEGDAFTDIFFYRGPNGFAVLGRSAPAHFRETRDLTRMVAESVDLRPESAKLR
jgi:hypothetical protein